MPFLLGVACCVPALCQEQDRQSWPQYRRCRAGVNKMEFSIYLLLGSDHKGKQGKVNLPKIATQRHKAIRVSMQQLPADHATPILASLICELHRRQELVSTKLVGSFCLALGLVDVPQFGEYEALAASLQGTLKNAWPQH